MLGNRFDYPFFSNATTISWAFAVAFALATVAGFVPNPLVGADALFVTNLHHNLVHLATAIGFAAVALIGSRASILFMKAFGSVYLLVGIVGFVVLGGASEGHLFGLVHINSWDNYLHVGLAAAILIAGFLAGANNSRAARA